MPQGNAARCLAFVRKHAHRLTELCDDPSPGLISWCEMYRDELTALSNYWQFGLDMSVDPPVPFTKKQPRQS